MRQLGHALYFCLMTCLWVIPLTGGWLERKAEGWAWYEDPQRSEKEIFLRESGEEITTPPPLPFPASDEVANVRKNLEEKLARAVLNPTQENVAVYMHEQKKWIDQSAEFSSAWAQVLLQQPKLDSSVSEFPVSQYGIQVQNQIQQEKRVQLMKRLIQHYGLFFFYEGSKKNSQAFALVVQSFAEKYGWEVIAISKDGYILEGFKENRTDNGIIQNLEIEVFPSLYLVNPNNLQITPIAYGLASLDRIENNVELQFQELVEGEK